MTVRVQELPYRAEVAQVFSRLAARPWSVWLDSGGVSRWDILACAPRRTLVTRGPLTEVRGDATLVSPQDPLALLRREMGPRQEAHPELPFCGGALGWFGYDLGRRFEQLPGGARDRLRLPDMMVGIYDWALVVDHVAGRAWLSGREGRSPRARRLLADAALNPRPPACGPFAVQGGIRSNLSQEAYLDRFRRIQDYIQRGDCYQVNLTRRFSVTATGDAWGAYLELRRRNPAPFSAFLNTPGVRILCASPERFLRVRQGQVETCPIKGTIRRLAEPEADRRQREALLASPKDRAENLMIVDLLRNDLGRTCALGSIRVPRLFRVESFADLHHLVSHVTGRLGPRTHALDLLRGCFPGGSVTGAPKIRAMQIIEELEGERRSVYCGSIGYVGFDGGMDTNIAIRTMVHARGELSFWAGGGIVADSGYASEADEVDVKVRAMRDVAEAFRLPRPYAEGAQFLGTRGR